MPSAFTRLDGPAQFGSGNGDPVPVRMISINAEPSMLISQYMKLYFAGKKLAPVVRIRGERDGVFKIQPEPETV